MKLGDLARELNCELRGSLETEIDGVAGIEEATATQLTFVSNPKYYSKIPSTRAGAIVVSRDAPDTGLPTLLSDNPYLAFARAIPLFYRPPSVTPGIHPTAIIAETAELGENHSIGAHAVIGDGVRVGRNAVVYPNVVIYPHTRIGNGFVAHSNAVVREHCRLGDRVILQNGAVIGGDGFGFAPAPTAAISRWSSPGW